MDDSGIAEPSAAPGRRGLEPGGLGLIVLVAAVLAWWAWQEGAYFGVVLLPGIVLLCAGTVLLAGRAPWRIDLRRSPPVAMAIGGLVGLGLWTLLSALWSPVPDVAVADGQRVLTYALLFGLGLWLASLLADRIDVAPVPVVAAAAVAGAAASIALATGDLPRDLLGHDGTLAYPFGYRNANAAFFAIGLFPAAGLAASARLDWRLRSLALGTATLSLEILLLSQSRGSIPALLLALVVYAVLAPFRVRALCWVALAALPALGIIPAVTDLYSTANDDGLRNAVAEMNRAGTLAGLIALASVMLGGLAARFEAHLPRLGPAGTAGNRTVLVTIVSGIAVATVGFVIAVENPAAWIGDRYDEFRSAGTPNLSEESSRFTFNAGSNRYDLWRVALDDFRDDPILGDGAGGFEYTYTRKRDVFQQDARDAHGIPFETIAELGLPGLLLLITGLGGACWGVIRARRMSRAAAGLGAIALASATYWILHGSIDWFWAYPAVTAPALVLLGSACAPGVPTRSRPAPSGLRVALTSALALLAVSAVPPFLAERYTNDAYSSWRSDLERAYTDLERARDLNRLSSEPILAEGAIARAAGDRERAIGAFAEVVEKTPEKWAAHYLLAELQAEADPTAAREAIRFARELNPGSQPVRSLARQLGVGSDTNPDAGGS